MPCDDCDEPCYQEVRCDHCNGSGVGQICAINGISQPTWFGLQHPLNLTEACPACRGRKYIRVFPEDLPCRDEDGMEYDGEPYDEQDEGDEGGDEEDYQDYQR